MTSQDLVLSYVAEQLDSLCERPEMWGPTLCVELQFLMLMEFWLVTTSPKLGHKHPRLVLEEFHAFRRRRGFDIKKPLADANQPIDEFKQFLRAFREDFLKRVAPMILVDFEGDVRDKFPLATTDVATGHDDAAQLRLDVRMGERSITVEWDPSLGFCVSRLPTQAQERSHVMDSQQALQRVGILLRRVVLTATERDQLRKLDAPMDPELADAPDELGSSGNDELTEQFVAGVRPVPPPRRARPAGG